MRYQAEIAALRRQLEEAAQGKGVAFVDPLHPEASPLPPSYPPLSCRSLPKSLLSLSCCIPEFPEVQVQHSVTASLYPFFPPNPSQHLIGTTQCLQISYSFPYITLQAKLQRFLAPTCCQGLHRFQIRMQAVIAVNTAFATSNIPWCPGAKSEGAIRGGAPSLVAERAGQGDSGSANSSPHTHHLTFHQSCSSRSRIWPTLQADATQ